MKKNYCIPYVYIHIDIYAAYSIYSRMAVSLANSRQQRRQILAAAEALQTKLQMEETGMKLGNHPKGFIFEDSVSKNSILRRVLGTRVLESGDYVDLFQNWAAYVPL